MDMSQGKEFVAVNTITCKPEYVARFRELFSTRVRAIDRREGFHEMYVLEPQSEGAAYLVISRWESEAAFHAWTKSPEFIEGHRRAFADLAAAKLRGDEPPMHSEFATYSVLTR